MKLLINPNVISLIVLICGLLLTITSIHLFFISTSIAVKMFGILYSLGWAYVTTLATTTMSDFKKELKNGRSRD